ncbi:AAA family ATPase [Gordonibacter urolithinfaciens]|uniref:AAA family ATPase n=1 Tax=Gordonibacter urolithinfaciens TaxID=1335613 RepID=UPI003A935AD8
MLVYLGLRTISDRRRVTVDICHGNLLKNYGLALLRRQDGGYICITRPRRLGKTVNAQMLASFLTRGLDAAPLFEGLEVSCDPAAMAHLGAHDVIYIDFSVLPDECESYRDYIDAIRAGIVDDLRAFAPEAGVEPRIGLFAAHECVYDVTKAQFCFIMDEWDSLFFNPLFTEDGQRSFLMLLKQLLKTKPYVELSHMAGILSIAKHSTGSELNMFVEYGAVEDLRYDRFFGFTQDEVCELCARHLACTPDARVGYEGLEHWYDGYLTEDGERRFSPRSVVLALIDDSLRSCWTESGPYDEIHCYVRNNIAAVRDDLVRMAAGEPERAEMENYAASSMSLSTQDDIFPAMVVALAVGIDLHTMTDTHDCFVNEW